MTLAFGWSHALRQPWDAPQQFRHYLAIRTLSKSDSMYTQVWLAVQLAGKVLMFNAPYGAVEA